MNVLAAYLAFSVVFLASSNAAERPNVESHYSDITGKSCIKHVDDKSTGAYTMKCAGIKGFHLLVHVDDERSSISVMAPDKRVFPLNYWDVVTPGFSSLGKKAEWRVTRKDGGNVPVGLIVRVNAIDQSNLDHPTHLSYLAVAKISREMACVTAVIKANTQDSNEQARRYADTQNLPCKQSDSNIP